MANVNPKGNNTTHTGAGPFAVTVGPSEHTAIVSQGGTTTDAVKSGHATKANVT